MKIICFVASLSQPRCIKRVTTFHNAGYEVEVYGYSRGYYNDNGYPTGIRVHDLGWIKSGGGYIGRFLTILFSVKDITKKYKREDVVYYIFSFDYALSFLLCSNKLFFYEISDIVYSYFNFKCLIKLFRCLDRYMIRKSYRTVLTSAGFQKYLFKDKESSNCIIQPNKVSTYFTSIKRKSLSLTQKEGLVFAYVGAFRYPNTVFRFANVIGKHYPQHSFYFYGDSYLTPLAVELSRKYNNVKYWGSFRSPDNIEDIYSNIDVVIACYDNATINERIAEPNKLYESICFCKPIIVSNNTYLADRVQELQVGFAIDASEDMSIIAFLDKLDFNELCSISQREYEMEQFQFIDSPAEILQALRCVPKP